MHESIYDEFVEKEKAQCLSHIVGDPFKKGVEQGPQVGHFLHNYEVLFWVFVNYEVLSVCLLRRALVVSIKIRGRKLKAPN